MPLRATGGQGKRKGSGEGATSGGYTRDRAKFCIKKWVQYREGRRGEGEERACWIACWRVRCRLFMRVLRRAFTSAAPFPAPAPAAASISSDLRIALEVAVTNADETPLAPLTLLFIFMSAMRWHCRSRWLALPALPLLAPLLASLPPIEARNTPARIPLWAAVVTSRMALPFRPASTSPSGNGVAARTLASVECRHSSQCPLPQNHPPSNWLLLPLPGRLVLQVVHSTHDGNFAAI
jgi:hypothetical protein